MTVLRVFVVCFLLFAPASRLIAQHVEWGVSAGVSFNGHTFEDPLPWWDNAGRLFPSVMLHAEIPMSFIEGPLGKQMFFSSGIRYTRLASKVDWQFEVNSTAQVYTGAFSINQHYLTVPVQFRVNLGRLPVFLLGGPEFGFLILARKKSDTFTPDEFSSSQSEMVGGDINRLNISLYGGAGIVVNRGMKVYVRYGKGLNHAKKDPERTVLDTDWSTKEIEFCIQLPVFGTK